MLFKHRRTLVTTSQEILEVTKAKKTDSLRTSKGGDEDDLLVLANEPILNFWPPEI